jgi:hypothetical protein
MRKLWKQTIVKIAELMVEVNLKCDRRNPELLNFFKTAGIKWLLLEEYVENNQNNQIYRMSIYDTITELEYLNNNEPENLKILIEFLADPRGYPLNEEYWREIKTTLSILLKPWGYEFSKSTIPQLINCEPDLFHPMKSLDTSSPEEPIEKFIDESLEITKRPCIFISHASEDSEIANEFASMFREKGIMTFVANVDILAGTNWEKKLKEEIYKSDELLLILSPESENSNWVMIEVGAAWILGETITPAVMYTNVNSIPEPIKKFQAKPIKTSSQRKNLVEDIAKRVQ